MRLLEAFLTCHKEGSKIVYRKIVKQVLETDVQNNTLGVSTLHDEGFLGEGLIIALNMGKTGNIPLKNQLVSMKARLVKQLSKSMAKEMDFSGDMRHCLQKNNFRDAIEAIKDKYFFAISVRNI